MFIRLNSLSVAETRNTGIPGSTAEKLGGFWLFPLPDSNMCVLLRRLSVADTD